MNSRITVIPVSLNLIRQALEYYWREQTVIKDNEDIKIILPFETEQAFPFEATVTINTDKGVEGKLVNGKSG
jgi:hypothetical protein